MRDLTADATLLTDVELDGAIADALRGDLAAVEERLARVRGRRVTTAPLTQKESVSAARGRRRSAAVRRR
jgi:hypothetical protein